MTRFLLVAAFAATSSVAAAQGAPAAPASAHALATTLTEWKVVMPHDTVKAGSVTFKVKNTGAVSHSLFVRGGKIAKGSKEIAANEEATFTLSLTPGTYEVYCPMSDLSHRMAGMTKQLVVLPGDAPAATKKPAPPTR